MARAAAGDRSVLDDAHRNGDGDLYDRLLDELVSQSAPMQNYSP